jgi:hypothetical protein
MTFRQHPQNTGVVIGPDSGEPLGAQRRNRDRRASFGSFFWDFSEPNRRTRAASIGDTSNTVSPAATSC